jgi:hypothetical protein
MYVKIPNFNKKVFQKEPLMNFAQPVVAVNHLPDNEIFDSLLIILGSTN